MQWNIIDWILALAECFLFVEFVTRYNRMDWTRGAARFFFFVTIFISFGFVMLADYIHAGMQARLLIRTILVFMYALYFLDGSLTGKVSSCLFFPCMLSISQALTGVTIARIINHPLRIVWGGPGIPHIVFQVFSLLILFYATRIFIRFRGSYQYPFKKIYIILSSMIPIITILFVCMIIDIMLEDSMKGMNSLTLIFSVTGILVINMVIYYLFDRLGHEGALERENQMLRQYLQYEQRHMDDQKRLYEQIRSLRHEMKNYLNLVEQRLTSGQNEEALTLLQNLKGHVQHIPNTIQSDNETLNFIINSNLSSATEHDIPCKIQISDTSLAIPDIDLHSMLGNMLMNAIEASIKEPPGERDLSLVICLQRGYHSFTVKNKVGSSVLTANPNLITTKEDTSSHGFGISVIRGIVGRYQGHVDFYEQDGYFCVQALIPEMYIKEGDKNHESIFHSHLRR